MKVLVCGGQFYTDADRIANELSLIKPFDLLIHGDSYGADRLAKNWADQRGIPICTFTANWSNFGRSAGSVRDGWMIKFGKPDLVIAFPGGRGTADMVRKARAANIEVREVR